MIIEALINQGANFVLMVVSWLPQVSLPEVDLSLVLSIMSAVNGIIPASALGISLGLAMSIWVGRGVMLGVRWVLWLVQLVRG